jgi:hypothetical protein
MGLLKTLALSGPKEEAGKTWPAILVGLFVAFGGVLFGCVFTILSVIKSHPADLLAISQV